VQESIRRYCFLKKKIHNEKDSPIDNTYKKAHLVISAYYAFIFIAIYLVLSNGFIINRSDKMKIFLKMVSSEPRF